MAGMVALAGMVACGGGDAQPATSEAGAETASPAATPGAMADEMSAVATEYAPSLGVDLSTMKQMDGGLYYQDITEGSGEAAKAGDHVVTNYTGWLPDGTKFDSSFDRHEPIDFDLGAGGMIKGWDEGVVGMKVGGKRRLVIPPGLGYGKQANGPIPPMSTLVFEIDLVGITK